VLSVVVIDDHSALSEGLSVLLERRGFRVLGCAATASEGAGLIAREAPDVAVVDLKLPDEPGDQLIMRLRSQRPVVKFVVYTGLSDPAVLASALHCGADGLVGKPASLRPLVDAIRTVGRGGSYLDPTLREMIEAADRSQPSVLSRRESQVLGLLSEGLTGEEIAADLFLSPETIRTHIRNAMSKLQARTRPEAIAKALAARELPRR
jgi:DNA-binding NarL/FixJ family response regulator